MINEQEQKTRCPHCKSEEVVKRGTFETEAQGKQQRFFCKKCSKKFIVRNAFYRMRNTPQKITLCLDLFYKGVSTRKIQQHLQAFYPHNSSWVSIYSWVVKYAKQISQFTDNLKLKVGSEVQVDEVEYHRRKSHKRKLGTEENWFIDSVDTQTRFMVASNYCKARNQKEIRKVMQNIKDKSDNKFKVITTDALTQYERVVKKVFGYYNLKKGLIVYNKVNASKGEGFNHPIERVHNGLRQRTKIFRGFHGSVESARAILKGFEIFYNFINLHQGIKCCPYELAIPELKSQLNVPNKWLSLIEMSNQNL